MKGLTWGALALVVSFGVVGCGQGDPGTEGPREVLGSDLEPVGTPPEDLAIPASPLPTPTNTTSPRPTGTATPSPTPTPSPTTVGTSCSSSDPNKICLAIRYVAYKDADDVPVMQAVDAIKNIATINNIWKACNIGFQIDSFDLVDPVDYGLLYACKYMREFDDIRRDFQTDDMLLVATTGKWNRNGDITQGNAWANYPGGSTHGAVVEAPSGKYGPIVAHELGHYLYLPHLNDEANVMNPTIYTTSDEVSSSQCTTARNAANRYWARMKR